MEFINIRVIDIIDICLVAVIMLQLYRLIRGTSAYGIAIGIFCFYLLWIIVKVLNMELLSLILGQVTGVGVIALIIVFQQEIRRFLLFIGHKYFTSSGSGRFSGAVFSDEKALFINEIVSACENMSNSHTGALIVIARKNDLSIVQDTGDKIDASVSQRLIETIFYKNTPLHDGAMIISNQRIICARCVLPTTERLDISANLGMRHRAAIGITEQTDSLALVVSEQTGRITVVEGGNTISKLTTTALKEILIKRI